MLLICLIIAVYAPHLSHNCSKCSSFVPEMFYLQLFILLGFYQCPCLPKAGLNTKNKTKRPLLNGQLVLFLVSNSITDVGYKVCVISDGINRVDL